MFPLRSYSLEDSSKIAQLSAESAGKHLAERINGVASIIRAYSGIIELLANSEIIPENKKREWLLAEMEMVLKKESKMTNIWCTFEPNALDGLDSVFVNREDLGSNSYGVFAPWFAEGKLSASEDDEIEDYYTVPKTTGREFITEPYWDDVNGEPLRMFSISVPLMNGDKFIGVAGADFYADQLNKMILNYNADVRGKLITDKGIIAISDDLEQTGKDEVYGNSEILDKLAIGEMFSGIYTIDGKKAYKVFVPVKLGNSNQTWFYVVEVPEEEIYANAQKTGIYLFVCCLIGAILIALAGGILIWAILKDITSVTDIIRHLSVGNINVHIDSHKNQDEIGKMKNELSKLVDGLKHTTDFARSIGEGDLNAEYRLLSDGDVLGNSLLEMRQSLQKAEKEQIVREKEEEQRNWGTAGLAKFAEILRHDNSNLEALTYNIICNMVKYLGANQGGIFILNDGEYGEDKVLEMKACYAFDRKKFAEKQIHPGEGLVGTCFLEGEPIYITEVPDSYITITSGLGEANPRAVLISPLKVNDEILGVIELASFDEFEPYQLEFVQKISESIAATISAVRVNLRTERLLTQTKMQAEEMSNQEEELRQNMEEMQATQEEMRRREDELNETLERMKEMVADGEHFKDKVHTYEAAITEANFKTEYSKKEVEKLAENIAKLAEGDIDCDFTVIPPNEYTQEEYEHYSAIATNLEQVRDNIRNLLSHPK